MCQLLRKELGTCDPCIVAAEYFFERPDLLQQKHPELFELLEQTFHQIPATIKTK